MNFFLDEIKFFFMSKINENSLIKRAKFNRLPIRDGTAPNFSSLIFELFRASGRAESRLVYGDSSFKPYFEPTLKLQIVFLSASNAPRFYGSHFSAFSHISRNSPSS